MINISIVLQYLKSVSCVQIELSVLDNTTWNNLKLLV